MKEFPYSHKLTTAPCISVYVTTLMTMKFLSQMTPIRTVPNTFKYTILVILITSIFKSYDLEMTLIYPLRYIQPICMNLKVLYPTEDLPIGMKGNKGIS